MISRIVPAAVLGAIAAEVSVNPAAAALVQYADYPAATALVVVPAAIGLVVGLVGLLATPSAAAEKRWRRGA